MRSCEWCGGLVFRPGARFCCTECVHAAKRRDPSIEDQKECARPGCTEVLTRRIGTESGPRFARRKYHSHACANATPRDPRPRREGEPKPKPRYVPPRFVMPECLCDEGEPCTCR